MNSDTYELLKKMQEFAQYAVKHLQNGNNQKAAFYFNLTSAVANELAAITENK